MPGTRPPAPLGSVHRLLDALTTQGEVSDLQSRLARLGILESPGSGTMDERTATAVREFQTGRGLRVDGICGPQTWAALVGAGFLPGDRLLYLRTPMMQGDDVAALQRQLGTLGFDAGRVDAIFGPATARALIEFQRNVAIVPDGICGLTTLAELRRLRSSRSEGALVGSVRERELLRRAPRTLVGRRVALGQQGGLGAALEAIRHLLIGAGAAVTTLLHPDGAVLAEGANLSGADIYLGLRVDPSLLACRVAYYRGYRYESAGGRRLAELAREQLAISFARDTMVVAVGMAIPELRSSTMPAIVCDLTPASLVVEHAAELATALVSALTNWAGETWE